MKPLERIVLVVGHTRRVPDEQCDEGTWGQRGSALQQLFETFPEIPELLRELRYDVAIEKRPELGELPLVTLRSALPAFRPSDELIAKATQFSGVPAFIELIDVEALARLHDPLRARIEAALA